MPLYHHKSPHPIVAISGIVGNYETMLTLQATSASECFESSIRALIGNDSITYLEDMAQGVVYKASYSLYMGSSAAFVALNRR